MFEFYFLIVFRRIHKPEVCMDVFIFIQIAAQITLQYLFLLRVRKRFNGLFKMTFWLSKYIFGRTTSVSGSWNVFVQYVIQCTKIAPLCNTSDKF